MSDPVAAITPFLRDHALAGHNAQQSELTAVASVCETLTLSAGERWLPDAEGEAMACLLMSGLVVLSRLPESDPVALRAGNGFGLRARRRVNNKVWITAADTSEFLLIRESEYQALESADLPAFDQLLTSMDSAGINEAEEKRPVIKQENSRVRLLSRPISDIMTSDPLNVTPNTSIQATATLMRENRVSCMPIASDGLLQGILTEADMTRRVVAVSRSVEEPVSSIMSAQPHVVHSTNTLFDALQVLTQQGVSHIPVVDENRLVGIVTQTDIIRQQTGSAVFLVNDVSRRQDSASIAGDTQQITRLLQSLVDAGANADEVGRTITSVTDAVTRRLIELALEEFGNAPVPWVWLACGSQGRQEQTGVTDQDNCLVLSDDYDEAVHGEWFSAFANKVCTGLDEAGYVFCPGDMMAMNARWRQPVRTWRKYFQGWIDRPGNKARMLASVMFDLRPIAGDTTLSDPLQADVLKLAAENSIFVAHMVANSLKHRPPLGLFGRLATQRRGPHRHRIDLKHSGVVPIVDLARLHALSGGFREVNTLARLNRQGDSGALSLTARRNLADAYEFITSTRLHHQSVQIKAGESPDNHLDPDQLSPLEREHLRDSMAVVRDLQSALAHRHSNIA